MQTKVDAARRRLVGDDLDFLDQASHAIDQLTIRIPVGFGESGFKAPHDLHIGFSGAGMALHHRRSGLLSELRGDGRLLRLKAFQSVVGLGRVRSLADAVDETFDLAGQLGEPLLQRPAAVATLGLDPLQGGMIGFHIDPHGGRREQAGPDTF